MTTIAASQIGGFPLQLTVLLFVPFAVITLFAALLTGSIGDEVGEFYLGDRELTPLRHGLAMCGDYLSAATLLGSTGLVALTGYDGILYLVGTVVAWLLVLLVIAQPLRNAGGFTFGDTLALRLPNGHRSVRIALAACTLTVSVLYLVAQLVGSVALLSQFVGVPGSLSRATCVIAIGTLVILFVAVGGMLGTTFIQVVKAVMLVVGVAVTAIMVMTHYHWNVNTLLGGAVHGSGLGNTFLHPGLRFGGSISNKLDFISLEIAIVLGLAALPHLMMRLLAPRRSSVLHRSLLWTIGLVGFVCLAAAVLGLGAVGIVGRDTITRTSPSGDAAVLLLAQSMGGAILTALITCLAFVTLLAVAAGLTLAAASSLAHDVYAEVVCKGQATAQKELAVARFAAFVIGALGILLALVAWSFNPATLAFLAFAIAASAILPTIVYSLFWRKFSATGALLSLYGGLSCSILLVVFSPVVSSTPGSIFPSADFAWFPLNNPGLVSVPAGFLLGWLGTVLGSSKDTETNAETYDQFEVRSLIGAD
ncbi:MAG: cation acetate symporter [Streptomycetaceae bacterium]|nr:cation acetate symporter [Streptomycetaceae bacterium]